MKCEPAYVLPEILLFCTDMDMMSDRMDFFPCAWSATLRFFPLVDHLSILHRTIYDVTLDRRARTGSVATQQKNGARSAGALVPRAVVQSRTGSKTKKKKKPEKSFQRNHHPVKNSLV